MPTQLPPGGRVMRFVTKKNKTKKQGKIQTNMSLSAEGHAVSDTNTKSLRTEAAK